MQRDVIRFDSINSIPQKAAGVSVRVHSCLVRHFHSPLVYILATPSHHSVFCFTRACIFMDAPHKCHSLANTLVRVYLFSFALSLSRSLHHVTIALLTRVLFPLARINIPTRIYGCSPARLPKVSEWGFEHQKRCSLSLRKPIVVLVVVVTPPLLLLEHFWLFYSSAS